MLSKDQKNLRTLAIKYKYNSSISASCSATSSSEGKAAQQRASVLTKLNSVSDVVKLSIILNLKKAARDQNINDLKEHPYFKNIDFSEVSSKDFNNCKTIIEVY